MPLPPSLHPSAFLQRHWQAWAIALVVLFGLANLAWLEPGAKQVSANPSAATATAAATVVDQATSRGVSDMTYAQQDALTTALILSATLIVLIVVGGTFGAVWSMRKKDRVK